MGYNIGGGHAVLSDAFAFGAMCLGKQLDHDSNSTYHLYRWTTNVVVAGNVNMKWVHRKFSSEGARVEEIQADSYEGMSGRISDEDTYHYILLASSSYLPLIKVEETEHINEYVADWDKMYVWCFFTWIQISDNLVGIS